MLLVKKPKAIKGSKTNSTFRIKISLLGNFDFSLGQYLLRFGLEALPLWHSLSGVVLLSGFVAPFLCSDVQL